jgi:putative heme iron utilization protein
VKCAVGTGCGKRRQLSQTSKNPDKVTCLACREWAREQLILFAEMGQAALEIPSTFIMPDEKRRVIAEQVKQHLEMAERFS